MVVTSRSSPAVLGGHIPVITSRESPVGSRCGAPVPKIGVRILVLGVLYFGSLGGVNVAPPVIGRAVCCRFGRLVVFSPGSFSLCLRCRIGSVPAGRMVESTNRSERDQQINPRGKKQSLNTTLTECMTFRIGKLSCCSRSSWGHVQSRWHCRSWMSCR